MKPSCHIWLRDMQQTLYYIPQKNKGCKTWGFNRTHQILLLGFALKRAGTRMSCQTSEAEYGPYLKLWFRHHVFWNWSKVCWCLVELKGRKFSKGRKHFDRSLHLNQGHYLLAPSSTGSGSHVSAPLSSIASGVVLSVKLSSSGKYLAFSFQHWKHGLVGSALVSQQCTPCLF